MELLLNKLKEIEKILEQINVITANQTTILLQYNQNTEDENEALSLLEGMIDYKEELINLVEKEEALFESMYNKKKEQLTSTEDIKLFKYHVGMILSKKEEIKQVEEANMTIMVEKAKKAMRQVEIPKNPQDVTAAYKKQFLKK